MQSDQTPTREHRCHGKIARLPESQRNLINHLLDEGTPYRLIIEKLQASADPPLPYPVSTMDISRWHSKGYQRYLAREEHFDFLRDSRQAALDLVATDDTITLPEATLQVIASQYCDLLVGFSPRSLSQKISQDPLSYTRLLNVFTRLSREILTLKQHRELSALRSRGTPQDCRSRGDEAAAAQVPISKPLPSNPFNLVQPC